MIKEWPHASKNDIPDEYQPETNLSQKNDEYLLKSSIDPSRVIISPIIRVEYSALKSVLLKNLKIEVEMIPAFTRNYDLNY